MDNVKTWKPIAGGILSIVAGALHVFGWLGMGLFITSSQRFFGNEIPDSPRRFFWILILPLAILAIMAIVGGVFSLMRKVWGLALAGSICAIFSPITWFLGVIATIFIAIAKNEFDTGSHQLPTPTPQSPSASTPPSPPSEQPPGQNEQTPSG